ncbi:hypothetical protein B296_00054374 [Ensete ventricosum]|uniref:Uncharacterized protein n=1 Tax=Ensete ventricosum TaxID=4639 RepID=A0A426XIF6_ENSVE|nr:hypothetical protein B296_00054374 [Ensete ventricosum]
MEDLRSVKIHHGRGARPNALETRVLKKPDLHKEKSATTEMLGQMHSRSMSQENLTHMKRNLPQQRHMVNTQDK